MRQHVVSRCGVPDVRNAHSYILGMGQMLASLLDCADVQNCTHRTVSLPLQVLSLATPVRVYTVIASYESISISILELALHILLQHVLHSGVISAMCHVIALQLIASVCSIAMFM